MFRRKGGTFTNSERRVQRVRKAVEPPGQARADWEIIVDLANRVIERGRSNGHRGTPQWRYGGPAEVYAEMVRDAPKFSGISHERIEQMGQGIQWPCPTEDHPGTTYLHEGGVLRGRGLFQAVDYRPSLELADETYPLVLSTGRTLYHYNAATQTRRAEQLDEKQPEAFVEVHPRDAKLRGIAQGDQVEVTTRRGKVTCRALVSRQVRRGCIWMPMHFAEARANLLTVDGGDAVTGTAEYKVCAAEVRRIGAGATETFPGSFYRDDGPNPTRR